MCFRQPFNSLPTGYCICRVFHNLWVLQVKIHGTVFVRKYIRTIWSPSLPPSHPPFLHCFLSHWGKIIQHRRTERQSVTQRERETSPDTNPVGSLAGLPVPRTVRVNIWRLSSPSRGICYCSPARADQDGKWWTTAFLKTNQTQTKAICSICQSPWGAEFKLARWNSWK